jgi:hypothetical protein
LVICTADGADTNLDPCAGHPPRLPARHLFCEPASRGRAVSA